MSSLPFNSTTLLSERHSLQKNQSLQKSLLLAIIASIALHVIFVIIIPNLKIDDTKTPDLIEVSILPPPSPEPVTAQPETPPETAKPPEKIKPKIEPKPIIKPLPKPVALPEPSTVAVAPPPTTEIAAVRKPESPTVPVATPEPAPPPQPKVVDTSAAQSGYGSALWGAISKHKKYPRIAQARAWQGEVILELSLDGDGNLLSKTIIQKSGYDVLDQQALEMVDKAIPFPTPPESLRGTSFSIKVPIAFKLEAR
jgi:protein TonB